MARKTNEIFLKQLNEVHGWDIEPLERYIGAKIKITFKCNVCSKEWRAEPQNVITKTGCPECAIRKTSEKNTKKYSHFIKYAKERMGETFYDYKILSDYIGNKKPLKLKHKKCGYEWSVTANNFIKLKSCPKCKAEHVSSFHRFSHETMIEKINKQFGEEEYLPLEKYVNSGTKITFRHIKCGFEWKVRPCSLWGGSGCPKCIGHYKRTNKDFLEEIKKLYGNKISILEKFINTKLKIYTKCNLCFYEWAAYPSRLLKGKGCPKCKVISTGEEIIRKYLDFKNIPYKCQLTFEDCRYTKPLPFDFALFSSGKLICLIEYDGEQHFRSVDHWGGEESLKSRKLKDNIKSEYCFKKNIQLIRIPYWEHENIYQILNDFFDKNSVNFQLQLKF